MLTARGLTKTRDYHTNARSPVLIGSAIGPYLVDSAVVNLRSYFNLLASVCRYLNVDAGDVRLGRNADFNVYKLDDTPPNLGFPRVDRTYLSIEPDVRCNLTLAEIRRSLFSGKNKLKPDDDIVVDLEGRTHFEAEFIVTEGKIALEQFLSSRAAKELLSKYQTKRLKRGMSRHLDGEDAWILSTFNLALGDDPFPLKVEWEQALFYQTE
jgi:hypothetical protein